MTTATALCVADSVGDFCVMTPGERHGDGTAVSTRDGYPAGADHASTRWSPGGYLAEATGFPTVAS